MTGIVTVTESVTDRSRFRQVLEARAWQLLAAVISVPIVLAGARGIRRQYLPIGDNALIEARGRDVLTAHHPWLGTWSSASLSAGNDVNHPGPLIFDLVALPVKLFGGGPGIAIAVVALHVGVVWAIGWSANRNGGATVAAVTLAFTGGLVWSLGSEMLYDPWQPNVLILPFLLVLVLVWGVVAGHDTMLPWAVVVASFCVQTHLSYVFIAPAAVALATAYVVARRWSARDEMPLVSGLRSVWWALAAGLVAWSQPIAEQLFGTGQGNLSRLATADSSGEGARTGAALGIRLVGAVVALPPWWGRTGFVSTIPITQWTETADGPVIEVPGLVSFPVALVSLVLLTALLGLGWWWARRSGDPVTRGAIVVVAAIGAVATLTVIITPIDRLGLSPHKIRWLWPLAVFVGIALAIAAVRSLRLSLDQRVLGAGAAVAVVFAVLAVPFHAQDSGPVAFRHEMPKVRSLVDQLDPLKDRGVVLFDAGGLRFAEPFTAPVMAGMQRRGIPFVLDEEGLVRQMGERRRYHGEADLVVYVREGPEALEVPGGVERIAFEPGLPDAERAELDALLVTVDEQLADGLEMSPDELADLAWRGEIDLQPLLGAQSDRFVDLQRRWSGWAVAVFATPHQPASGDGR